MLWILLTCLPYNRLPVHELVHSNSLAIFSIFRGDEGA